MARLLRAAARRAMEALAIVAVAAPAGSAQSPTTLEISPFVAVASWSATPATPVMTPGSERPVSFDANYVLGVTADLSWRNVPLRLRVGVLRSMDGDLETFSHLESCGSNCFRSVNSDVGSAAVTTVWGELVLAPYTGRFVPYAFSGVMRQTTSYGEVDASMGQSLDGFDDDSFLRFGVGLEVDLPRGSALWIETATYRAVHSLELPAPSSAVGGLHPSPVALGLKLRLF